MKIPFLPRRDGQAGFALLMVMVMLAISFMILGATMARTATNTKLIDRNNAYVAATTAAEAATEKSLALLTSDYQQGSEALILSNLATYQAAVPTSTESSYWTNFQFSDAQGHTGKNYVGRNSVAPNAVFTQLAEQYAGLSGFSSTYRILSNVKPLNSPYNVTAAVQQDVQVAEIPVFQFAIFYNGLMEYTWCAPFTVTGRVHCNSNIYVGSSSALTFNYTVTSTGVITNPPWDGHTQGQYTGAVNYNGTPAPGYDTGYASLTLPIGTNNTAAAVREIINLPAVGESATSTIGQQRYYNKAGMDIIVSDTNIVVTLKNSPTDPLMLNYTNGTVFWTNAGFTNFLDTNVFFYDQREAQTMKTTQIDVAKFRTWLGTNVNTTNFLGKITTANPLNIVYVDDLRTNNATTNTAVRLVNATRLPDTGLTVATINPLYIWGNYNCWTNAGTTNTLFSAPASLVSDALTILSSQWDDSKSAGTYGNRNNPLDTTINTAIIAGTVYTTGSTATTFSGGVMNLPRLLENWSGHTLTMNTSIVNLYNSVRATHQFQNPNIYYNAPTRNWNFDQNFTSAGKLPPGTPLIRRILRSSFCNPPPGITNYNATNDYVPH